MNALIRFMLGLGCVGTAHTISSDLGPVSVAALMLWLLYSGGIRKGPSAAPRSGRLILSGRNV